jgi:hypothetical protein
MGLDSENSNQINMVSKKLHFNFIEPDIKNKWMAIKNKWMAPKLPRDQAMAT